MWCCPARRSTSGTATPSAVYSDTKDRYSDTTGHQILRGYQITDSRGMVRFNTVYPGWYGGRAVHIHSKVRVPVANGATDEFTSQLYLPDQLTDRVHVGKPYAANKGQRLLNARDMIFRDGGAQLVLPVDETDGSYAATLRIAMGPGEPPAERFGRRERRPPRPF